MHTPEQVIDALWTSGLKKGRIYDAGCGMGASSNRLKELGFEVTASTYSEEPKLAPGIEWCRGVDLNKRLPFADESFDGAILQEVIEHLENHAHVVREFNRVLKPGGRWALTTPNTSCLRSRLHFLVSGFQKGRRRPANYNLLPGDYSNLFIPFLPTLHYLLWSYGFRVAYTGRSERKWSSVLLYVLLFPILQLVGRRYLKPYAHYESARQNEATRELARLLYSPHVLMDENLVLVLEKRHGLQGLYTPEAEPAQRALPVGALS